MLDIKTTLKTGESQTVEFKSSFGREAIETLVAFANAKGGNLYIGISNTSEVISVSISSESLQQWINQIKPVTSPSIIADAERLS